MASAVFGFSYVQMMKLLATCCLVLAVLPFGTNMGERTILIGKDFAVADHCWKSSGDQR